MRRRVFLRWASGAVATVAWPFGYGCSPDARSAPEPAHTPGQSAAAPPTPSAPLVFFDEAEARTLRSVLELLLPGGGPARLPSGSDAGVLAYIDGQLALPHFAGLERMMRTGLAYLERAARRDHGASFHALGAGDRATLLAGFQVGRIGGMTFPQARFFQQLHSFALEGYLGPPRHGGNRDRIVWHALGIDPSCAHMYERCD